MAEITKIQNDYQQIPLSGPVYEAFWTNIMEEHKRSKRIPKCENLLDNPYTKRYADKLCDFDVVVGSVINGKITGSRGRDIIIDFGYKDNAYVHVKSTEDYITKNMSEGDDIEFMVVGISEYPYEIKGSVVELMRLGADKMMQQYFIDGTPFEATVASTIPAGFMLDTFINNVPIKLFMPNTLAGVNKLSAYDSANLVGTEITVMLESPNKEKDMYVVSHKKYLSTLIADNVKKLVIGNTYEGTCTGTAPFGVFVEFDGFDKCLTGMIMTANIAPNHTIEDYKEGVRLSFYLRDILETKTTPKLVLSQVNRVSIWDTMELGNVYIGKVKDVKQFGVLISLDEETNGFITNNNIKNKTMDLSKDKEYKVVVTDFNRNDRKIFLQFLD